GRSSDSPCVIAEMSDHGATEEPMIMKSVVSLALAGLCAWANSAAAQSPSTGFPNVINALKAAPGCLGVETGETSSGRQVICAWTACKKALVDGYHSEARARAWKSGA